MLKNIWGPGEFEFKCEVNLSIPVGTPPPDENMLTPNFYQYPDE